MLAGFECRCALPAMLAPAIQCCCCFLAWPMQLQLPQCEAAVNNGCIVVSAAATACLELDALACGVLSLGLAHASCCTGAAMKLP
jgi:hypothetical protein